MKYNIIDLITTVFFTCLMLTEQTQSAFILFIIYYFYVKNEAKKLKTNFRFRNFRKLRYKNRNLKINFLKRKKTNKNFRKK